MRRAAFLIDGFNLYHSVRRAQQALQGASTKWLDIRRLCQDRAYLIGRDVRLSDVFYFSALARHLEAKRPDVTVRHQIYLDCLRDSGVSIELARFKPKVLVCDRCHSKLKRYEEKETDVAIAVKLLELFHKGECEIAVLVTGDTDVAPAVRAVARLYPQSELWFAFPYDRKNKELGKLAPSFSLSKDSYASYQLADPYICVDGRSIKKPSTW